jgi:Domain of unknown function (DUF4042)
VSLQSSRAAAVGRNGPNLTLAHALLLDSSARVRHSAAVTLGTLLEGPAQRAYLAVAELASTVPQQQALRGFVPLSATLGNVVVGTHQALLHALKAEQDSAVIVAILRALGTCLVGTPYSRLPPALLPNSVDSIRHILQKAQQAPQQESNSSHSASAYHCSVPLLSGSLACLAAALGVKPPLPSLSMYLSNKIGIDLAQEIFSCIVQYGNYPAVQLEAIMALRGLTQQYHAAVQHLWTEILNFAFTSLLAGITSTSSSSHSGLDDSSSRSHNNGIVEGGPSSREKVIQQSILLLGDYLRHSSSSSTGGSDDQLESNIEVLSLESSRQSIEQKWNDAVEMCLYPVLEQYESPLLQAAGFSAVATGLSSNRNHNPTKKSGNIVENNITVTLISKEMRANLLATCSKVVLSSGNATVEGGAASPVRAAALKAMASLLSVVSLPQEPLALTKALPSLLAACQDPVVAVRVQAAAALAVAAETLSSLFRNIETKGSEQPEFESLRTDALNKLLHIAVAAAVDGDKVKPSGVQALGTLLACRLIITTFKPPPADERAPARQWLEESLFSVETERDAFIACILSENVKVQWSACSAAGMLLETLETIKGNGSTINYSTIQGTNDGTTDAEPKIGVSGLRELVEALQKVAEESNNSRSRELAKAALAHLQ